MPSGSSNHCSSAVATSHMVPGREHCTVRHGSVERHCDSMIQVSGFNPHRRRGPEAGKIFELTFCPHRRQEGRAPGPPSLTWEGMLPLIALRRYRWIGEDGVGWESSPAYSKTDRNRADFIEQQTMMRSNVWNGSCAFVSSPKGHGERG